MHNEQSSDEGRALLSNRTVEIVVALLFICGSAVVIYDCLRMGAGWREDGPAPGFFPFWVAALMGVASVVNLITAIGARDGGETFVSTNPFLRVLAVLVPTAVYIGVIGYLGIYAASALFIMFFMLAVGRENILKAILVSIFIPGVLFLMFEKWFLVPLPKGPLEAMIGL
ncbi:MAG: tripartite tricarboxylate transporter TctB family protein [Rubrivivax sp.]|nr:tripartite tricarboxylate transporter TctB family protein [Rubrivivax sp.]